MAVIKNEKTNMWEVRTYYKNYKGERKQKTKRGFKTKKAAKDWERQFKLQDHQDMDMTLEDFYEIYKRDTMGRVRPNTWAQKEVVIKTKILPYLGKRKLNDLKVSDIFEWQNEMRRLATKEGLPLSDSYLNSIHGQLSAMLNHAVKYYGLKENVASKAGNMASKKNRKVDFWTQKEYQKFVDTICDKPQSFYAFEVLYWTGIRVGELLALTPNDYDFDNKTLKITKSYKRVKGKDIITDPKTVKSIREVKMPDFLIEEVKEYLDSLYGYGEDDRIFQNSTSFLHHEMNRGSKLQGLRKLGSMI